MPKASRPTISAPSWEERVRRAQGRTMWRPEIADAPHQVLTLSIEEQDGAGIRAALARGATLDATINKRLSADSRRWLSDSALVWMCKHPPEGFILNTQDIRIEIIGRDNLDECVYQGLVRLTSHQDGWLATLLAAGADPNLPRSASPTKMRPLHVLAGRGSYGKTASQLAAAQALLEAGADINGLDSEGATPLHLALNDHDAAYAHWLLDQRANPRLKNIRGQTPLHVWACRERAHEWQLHPAQKDSPMWSLLHRLLDAGLTMDDRDQASRSVWDNLDVRLGKGLDSDSEWAEACANKTRWNSMLRAWTRHLQAPAVLAPVRPRARH